MSNLPRFDECLAYINCQLKPKDALQSGPQTVLRWRALTISREAGCGASAIAEQVQKTLHASAQKGSRPWTIFDHNLLELVLADHDLSKRIAEFMPESRTPIIADMVEESFGLHPPTWLLVRQTAETVLRLAELGNVILIGRGASVITRKLAYAFHVRLIGSLKRRLARVQAVERLDKKAALNLILQKDEGRASFLKQHFKKDIESPGLYHLTINTDMLSATDIARIISNIMLTVDTPGPHSP